MNNLHVVQSPKVQNQRSDIPTILMVEDDEAFSTIFMELMSEEKVPIQVVVAGDGDEALAFLSDKKPHLILLDLNLPKQNGFEILKKIKTNPHLVEIPIIVLSSTETPDVINLCYQLHANSYVIKPNGLKEYQAILRDIMNFWFQTAELPRDLGDY